MAFIEVDRWSGVVAVVAVPAPVQGRIWAVFPWDPNNQWYIQDGTIPELVLGQTAGARIMIENPTGSTRSALYYTLITVTGPTGTKVTISEPAWNIGLGGHWDSVQKAWVGETSPVTVPLQGRWWEIVFTVDKVGSYTMEIILYAEGA